MTKLPTKQQFESLIKLLPEKYYPFFEEIKTGRSLLELRNKYRIPAITTQWICYKITMRFFGFRICPKKLQFLMVIRALVDGEPEESVVKRFGRSAVRNAKLTAFDIATSAKKTETYFDENKVGVLSYRNEK